MTTLLWLIVYKLNPNLYWRLRQRFDKEWRRIPKIELEGYFVKKEYKYRRVIYWKRRKEPSYLDDLFKTKLIRYISDLRQFIFPGVRLRCKQDIGEYSREYFKVKGIVDGLL